ncbi:MULTISPECIES: carbamoyl phosphate synthase small subunit [unclassified Anaerotruncus]|jgi:carbamoyl-phosphate synthase small subunit|uniref:carbamoyl phosphate synthase small subunit n=1 Tax=unclassified Anaerotruncus TaxID=2641626 RepID=UPI00033784CF|nr:MULTISPECIES: carbamoyl phosphate synthase small subunit [unclassified Anaerotruncus]MCI9160769.1 glutamine-hydrolyzing carbamoyl-phosphate synthase small subunit [Anaerotruncus sp.]NCE76014.1 carbamoyl-phosphate synthase small subunit [Anaerotruncus sp. X29]RKJ92389.1 carbamoyl-phosphate synthase small subunit [Anaerotruncus sp. 1XD22-93]EOS63122.1 carbamoyl-phosphate synthase, small subunit [Anaerotruncus sp. G3(2012)]MCI9235701.1 glutamine-hydrolyzing carbamoyl-phosphate synthase small s
MQILQNEQKATLLLADGTVFEGLSFGAQGTTIGEVVFTTGMTGYQEALTDPSYCGQIVTQTFPLVGNYGVNEEDQESDRSYVKGYVVREWCECPSNFRCEGTIDAFLKKHDIIGLYDIDTRALTRKIREHGVMNGMITTEEITDREAALERIGAFAIRDAVRTVTAVQPKKYTCENPQYEVALIDYGYKRNIRRSLLLRGCNVTVLPATVAADQLREGGFDGIMLSNGPGDPSENTEAIENLREIARLGIPIFGICLGHQLMALAQGAKTAKLKYGHRGGNQPVIDLATGLTYVTSQNHGYEVLGETLPASVGKVSHINANDKSCEGVQYGDGSIFTVQFHPEAHSGPEDTGVLFDRFVDLMKAAKSAKEVG